MKNKIKFIPFLAVLSLSGVIGSLAPTVEVVNATSLSGDLNGSAHVTSGGYCGFHYSTAAMAIGANDIYLRVRNNSANAGTIWSHINSRNNARVTLGKTKTYYTYDASGNNQTACTTDASGYIALAGGFDGFIQIPYASYEANTGWSSATFNNNDLYAVYFEGALVDADFGDLFTNAVSLYDGSETLLADFSTKLVNDFSATLSMNDGYKTPTTTEFDYTEVAINDEVNGGGTISCKRDTMSNDFAEVTITLDSAIDLSSAFALTMRIKAVSGSYPFFFYVCDENGNSLQLPANTSTNKIKYINSTRDSVVNCANGGNDHTIMYPANADGTLLFEFEKLEAYSGTIDLTNVKSFKISVAVFYDYGFNCTFGDLGYITKSTKTWTSILDASEKEFASTFSVTKFSDYISVVHYKEAKYAPTQGDVKILNTLSYKDDTELKNAVTWNEGDNVCSYSVQDDAMKVHIGPYEIGHQYGSYMALLISNDAKYDDYSFTRTNSKGTVEYAKGLSIYVKNLSRKEIGINLQFDEKITSSTFERWIMKGYPAMYYAYDINKDAEYTFYCTSDQFQIPVGFEGYVRLPFDQMQVPDWCIPTAGVDQVLDITKWNQEFFLTSDNTRYEDLEFLIKDVGVYFNETSKGTLFDNSHSIKTNMGL